MGGESVLLNRIEGTVFGGAIGDALGTLVEEMDKETVKRVYGGPILGFREPSSFSVCPFLREGQYSHETQMFILALLVYIEKGKFDEDYYVEKLVEWLSDEKNHRYPAGGHLNAAAAYKQGAFPDEARVKSSEVDGVIPAVAAGLYRWDNGEDAYNEGCQIVSVVYNDDILIDCGGIVSVAVSSIVGERAFLEMDDGKIEFLDMLRSFSQVETVRSYLDLVINTLMDGIENIDELVLRFGNGNFVLESLSLSLYIFLKWGNDFRKAVLKAVNSYGDFGGDTDAIGFLTGAFSGGYVGKRNIPVEWIENVENSSYLDLLSKKFFEVVANEKNR